MRRLFSNKGQSTLEYAFVWVLIAVVLAMAMMSKYVRRGVQGMFKMGADAICTRQYEP